MHAWIRGFLNRLEPTVHRYRFDVTVSGAGSHTAARDLIETCFELRVIASKAVPRGERVLFHALDDRLEIAHALQQRARLHTRANVAIDVVEQEAQRFARAERAEQPAPMTAPRWALRLFTAADAARYAQEWAAHLQTLQRQGKQEQARRDRRRFAARAPLLALELRLRARIRRARRPAR